MGRKLLSIRLVELIVSVYDFITLPVYYLLLQPWAVRRRANRMRAKLVDEYTWANVDSQLDKSKRRSVDTIDQMFRDSVQTYAKRNCLGVRQILDVEYIGPETSNGCSPNGLTKTAKGSHHGKANNSESNQQQQENQNTTTTNSKSSSVDSQKDEASQWPPTRVARKYVLDDKYTWFTYEQVETFVRQLSAGIETICKNSLVNSDGSRKVLICADTCMVWFLMAQACFRNGITVVTAYTTLDDEAILHSISQTEVRVLVVSQKFARRLPKIVAQATNVDTVILLDEPLPGSNCEIHFLKGKLLGAAGSGSVQRVMSYSDLLARGKQLIADGKEPSLILPEADDIAVLMYTSGSTGKAKGVMLSHKSIVYTALAFSGPGNIDHQDRYIGYLPLGHVLELAAECIFLRNGSTIAYSSTATLTSASPMVGRGQLGDAAIFKPTIMGAVPLVLDRVRSGLQQAIKARGDFWDQLINGFVLEYKRYWWEHNYDTPLMNRLICRKFNMILGGELRAVCSGGAALSRETQEYLRHVPNFTVLQGYGLTETSAAASFCDIDDRRYNVVGPPYPIVRIKLESWSDYCVTDKPYPRGEVIVGGQPVSMGYYKMEEQTRESFFLCPKTGIRYFRTGDIGLMLPDGCLKIIDRKKDIVKPLSGEYISLQEIETAIRTAPIVDNLFVYCSQYSNYVITILKPDQRELKRLAKTLCQQDASETGQQFRLWVCANLETNSGSTSPSTTNSKNSKNTDTNRPHLMATTDFSPQILSNLTLEMLCSSSILREKSLKMIQEEGQKRGLKRTQIPSRCLLVADEWSPESGLVTASFKLRRRELERHYQEDIKRLYAELGQNIDQNG